MEFDIHDLTSVQLVCNRCSASVNVPLGTNLKMVRRKKPQCECGKLLVTSAEQATIQTFVESLAELRFNTPHTVDLRLVSAREPAQTA